MKKTLLPLLFFLLAAAPAWGAGYIGDLTPDTSPTPDDMVETENSPGSSPNSRKVTLGDLIRKGHGLTGPGRTIIDGSAIMNVIRDKLDATAAPGVGDDSGDGYAISSIWIDLTGDTVYMCVDATLGAAVWKNLSASGGGHGEPGGNDGELQWNDAGTLNGIANWETDGTDLTPVNGAKIRTKTTDNGHSWCIQAYDVDGAVWANVVCFENGNTPTMRLASGASFSGLGTFWLQNGESIGNAVDGEVKIAGSESIIFDFKTTDTVVVKSDSGVTDIDLGALNLGTTGILTGLTRKIGNWAAPVTSNPYPLAAANAYNVVIYYGATGTINLDAVVLGQMIFIMNTGAFTITINPHDNDRIVRQGTAQADGVSITLSSGAGNFVTLLGEADGWVTAGKQGDLAQGS